jgi:tetratricopeptide (TPR) repeat protein
MALSLEPNESQADLVMQFYDMALDMTPREDFFHFEKGRVLLKQGYSPAGADQGKIREGIETFLEAQKIAPLNADHTKGLAQAHQVWAFSSTDEITKNQHLQLAEYYHDITTTLSPNNAFLWNMWVRFNISTGNLEGAQEVVSKSLAVDDEYDETWVLQAEIYRQQQLFEEMVVAFEHVVEINPRHTNGWLGLGNAYSKQGLFAGAANAYEQAVELKPKLLDGWLGLGGAYRSLGDWSAAAQAYETALQVDSANFNIWYILGSDVYPHLGRLDESIFALQRSLELAPENRVWETHYALSINYSQLGQRDEAVGSAQLALELAPEEHRAELEALLKELEPTSEGEQP